MLSKVNKKDALNYILTVAGKYNISQRILCENILDYSHFNKICNGKEKNISWDLLLSISARIGITTKDICDNCLLTSVNQYNDMWNKLDESRSNHDYEYIQEIITNYSKMKTYSIYEQQLFFYAKSIVSAEIRHNYEEAIDLLAQSYRLTNPYFKLPTLKKHKSYNIETYMPVDNEIVIYLGIIICINHIYNYEVGISLLINLYDYIIKKNINTSIKNKICYNIAYNYYMMKNYKQCHDILINNIDNYSYLKESDKTILIFSYYLLIISSHHLNEFSEINNYISKIESFRNYNEVIVDTIMNDLTQRNIFKSEFNNIV